MNDTIKSTNDPQIITNKDFLWIIEMINTDYFLGKANYLKELCEEIKELKLDCELASNEKELKETVEELTDKLKELADFKLDHSGADERKRAWELEELLKKTKK